MYMKIYNLKLLIKIRLYYIKFTGYINYKLTILFMQSHSFFQISHKKSFHCLSFYSLVVCECSTCWHKVSFFLLIRNSIL